MIIRRSQARELASTGEVGQKAEEEEEEEMEAEY